MYVRMTLHFQMPIIIIGGVAAAGKTSTAKKLSELFHWDYIEADEYHSNANITKMQAGIALNDDDRWPWLKCLHEKLHSYSMYNQNCILTCSALKKVYRQVLLTGSRALVDISMKNVHVIMLTLTRKNLEQRLLQRQHKHFMHPNLLDSQLETLELPTDEPYASIIECDHLSQDDIIERIKMIIHRT
jgi:gluconokinase